MTKRIIKLITSLESNETVVKVDDDSVKIEVTDTETGTAFVAESDEEKVSIEIPTEATEEEQAEIVEESEEVAESLESLRDVVSNISAENHSEATNKLYRLAFQSIVGKIGLKITDKVSLESHENSPIEVKRLTRIAKLYRAVADHYRK